MKYIDELYSLKDNHSGRITVETVDEDTYQAIVTLFDERGDIIADELSVIYSASVGPALTEAENTLEFMFKKATRPQLRIVR